MKPYDFKWTKFYESNLDFPYSELHLDLTGNELIICSTFIDADNYSILTTQRLITKQDGQTCIGNIEGATDKVTENLHADFKGHKDKLFTFGYLQLQNGTDLKYFVETGNASMVMIHAVRTLIRTKEMTDIQVDKVARIWNKQNET